MKFEILNVAANLVNVLIFLYILTNTSNTCFSGFQMGLSAFGLFASVSAQILSSITKENTIEN